MKDLHVLHLISWNILSQVGVLYRLIKVYRCLPLIYASVLLAVFNDGILESIKGHRNLVSGSMQCTPYLLLVYNISEISLCLEETQGSIQREETQGSIQNNKVNRTLDIIYKDLISFFKQLIFSRCLITTIPKIMRFFRLVSSIFEAHLLTALRYQYLTAMQ